MSAIKNQWVKSLLCTLFVSANVAWGQPVVDTDFEDYSPGSKPIITGSGFAAEEVVQLQIVNTSVPDDKGDEHLPWQVKTDAKGNFKTDWFVTEDEVNAALHLTALGLTSEGLAENWFTVSPNIDGSGVMTVTPKRAVSSTTNTLTFTFKSEKGMDYQPGSLLSLEIPADWSEPQIKSDTLPGFLKISPRGKGAGIISKITGTGPWQILIEFSAPKNGTGFVLAYQNAKAPGATLTNVFAVKTKEGGSSNDELIPLGGVGSPVVMLIPDRTTKLAFITPVQRLAVGVDSSIMTVQVQTSTGKPIDGLTDRIIHLRSTSAGGTFKDIDGKPVTSLIVPAGKNSVDFYYNDWKVGVPIITLTSSDPSLILSASQRVNLRKGSSKIAVISTSATTSYRSPVAFTAILPTEATGTVAFKTNDVTLAVTTSISSGTAGPLTTTNLARGMHVVTAEYPGDENFLGSTNSVVQLITNRPPVVRNSTIHRVPGMPVKIPLNCICTNWNDDDGDDIKIASVTKSTKGVTLYTNSAFILYSSSSTENDQFTYTVSDGFGGTANAQVEVINTPFMSGQEGGTLSFAPGKVIVKFMGIPGFTYRIQYNTNLASPVWNDVSTNMPNASGAILYTNTINGAGMGYYRLKWQP